jgi:hypothetical protein
LAGCAADVETPMARTATATNDERTVSDVGMAAAGWGLLHIVL